MSYAIVETGGKQYRVQPGDIIYVEKLNEDENTEISLDKVIAISINEELTVGAPYIEGAAVSATVLKNGRGKKIRVFTYKPKKNYHRTIGHRQPYTKLQIGDIAK